MFLLLPSILTFGPFFTPQQLPTFLDTPSTGLDHFTPQTPSKQSDLIRIAQLANLIGSVESDQVGGYNAANAGSAMDLGVNGLTTITGKSCEELTLKEISALQQRNLLYAVGRYQMIPSTFKAAIKWANLPDTAYFSPETQDRLLLAILQHKRPKVWQYILTGKNAHAAVNDLAREWAGIPTTSGYSHYSQGNQAHTTVNTVLSVLHQVRLKFAFS